MGRPFVKGKSGNPAGRPCGIRNKATRIAELLLDGEAEALTRKAVEMALAGDGYALRLCLERVIAPRRERPVAVPLPPIRGGSDLVGAMAAVARAVRSGRLAPVEAGALAGMIGTFLRTIEASDFERRLQALEARREPGA
ncbi:MAG: DUF5681 domain-containing protein [Stellaceae bacterium]